MPDFPQLNLIAILVAGIAGFAVGAVWYAPFTFGPLWLRYNPVIGEMLAHSTDRPRAWLSAFVGSLIQALILAILLGYAQTPDVIGGLWLAILYWLGFTATPSYVDYKLSRRPPQGWLVDMGHRLLVILVMAFLLEAWPF